MLKLFKTARLAGAVALAAAIAAPSVNAGSAVAYPGAMPPPFALAGSGEAQLLLANHRDSDRLRSDRMSRREFCRTFPRRCGDLRQWRHADRDDHDFRPRYKRGYRGYPYYRQGYRMDNDGWWYPLAAFALAMIIASQADGYDDDHYDHGSGFSHIPAGNMRAHDDWCDARYRSYSRTTKTFQPYSGPRRYCNSPYDLL